GFAGPGGKREPGGLRPPQPAHVHAEQPGVLVDRREQAAPLPLELDPQHVDHVAARQHVVQLVGHLHAQPGDARRHQRGWAADDDVGPQLDQAVNVAAGDAAVGDVADQADRQAVDAALDAADGEDVEQALRRVFVGPVAGVDHVTVEALGQQVRRPGDGVADDHDIDAHRLDVLGRVNKRFAFGEG